MEKNGKKFKTVYLKDFSFFIGLPFPFSKKDCKSIEDIEKTLKKYIKNYKKIILNTI